MGLVTDAEHRPPSEESPLSPGFEMRYDTLRGAKGETGQRGERGAPGAEGPQGEPFLTSRKAWAVVYLFALAVLLSVVALFWINHEVRTTEAAQQRQQLAQQRAERQAGLLVEHKICQTLASLAALKPPAGNPRTNPSRAFDDSLHSTLDGLGPDLGCSR